MLLNHGGLETPGEKKVQVKPMAFCVHGRNTCLDSARWSIKPPLEVCLGKVAETRLALTLVAHRYGWVPDEEASGEKRSIMWLECQKTLDLGNELLVFAPRESLPWPDEK